MGACATVFHRTVHGNRKQQQTLMLSLNVQFRVFFSIAYVSKLKYLDLWPDLAFVFWWVFTCPRFVFAAWQGKDPQEHPLWIEMIFGLHKFCGNRLLRARIPKHRQSNRGKCSATLPVHATGRCDTQRHQLQCYYQLLWKGSTMATRSNPLARDAIQACFAQPLHTQLHHQLVWEGHKVAAGTRDFWSCSEWNDQTHLGLNHPDVSTVFLDMKWYESGSKQKPLLKGGSENGSRWRNNVKR